MSQQDVTGAIIFNGSYLQRLSATFGINSQPTTVEMTLIEGNRPSDIGASGFDRHKVLPGTVTGIKVGSFEFVGMVQSWNKKYGVNGFTHEVRMVDPRALMTNVQIGIGTFSPNVDIPNYLNVFRYYDSPSEADLTSNGMAFRKIRDYLTTSGVVDVYGQKFELAFSSGFQDSDDVINPTGIPKWYRIDSDSVSLESLVQQTSADLGMDYYAYIPYSQWIPNAPTGNKILFQHIYRVDATGYNSLENFVSGILDSGTCVSYSLGQELIGEANTAIVHGPPKVYWRFPQANQVENVWGQTQDGSYVTTPSSAKYGAVLLDHIIGSGSERITDQITVPIVSLQRLSDTGVYPPQTVRIFANANLKGYNPTTAVMRAALYSQPAWEAMVWKEMPSFADQLGIRWPRFLDVSGLFFDNQYLEYTYLQYYAKLEVANSGLLFVADEDEALLKAVYDATRTTVDEYWGKKWLIQAGTSAWLATGTYDSTALYPPIEFKPADAAWPDRSLPSGIGGNHPVLKGSYSSTFKNNVGCIRSFLSVDNVFTTGYVEDSSIITPISDLFPLVDTTQIDRSTFLEETVNNKLVFPLNVEVYDADPDRFLVSLNSPLIKTMGFKSTTGYYDKQSLFDFLLNYQFPATGIRYFNLMDRYDELKEYGLEKERIFCPELSNEQYGFFIAMESNVDPFGPFISSGTRPAGVRIVNDGSLAPWTFGSYDNFEMAGQQMAESIVSNATVIDQGDVTVAGWPMFNLGDFIGEASLITGLSIQYGADGLTTSYQIKTYAFPPVRITKLLSDRISNVYTSLRQTQKQLIDVGKDRKEKEAETAGKTFTAPKYVREAFKLKGERNDKRGSQMSGRVFSTMDGTMRNT